ncbi:hypothetical protein [Lysobacter xanthus]
MSATRSDWTLLPATSSAVHVTGLTVVALPARGRTRYRTVPLPGTLPAPGPGLSDDDVQTVARIVDQRVREGGRLLREALRRRRRTATLH